MCRLFGLFSGFPSYHFPLDIANRFRKEFAKRDRMVFVCSDPADHERTDREVPIMRGCFEEIGLSFARYDVIDDRIEPVRAAQWISEATCIHLMGGHPGLQRQYLRETGLDTALRRSSAALFGVSAGAINMAVHSLDTKESLEPYEGLGLVGITVKPHFDPQNLKLVSTLKGISYKLPIHAMEDNSAIFIAGEDLSFMGSIYRVDKGEIMPAASSSAIR